MQITSDMRNCWTIDGTGLSNPTTRHTLGVKIIQIYLSHSSRNEETAATLPKYNNIKVSFTIYSEQELILRVFLKPNNMCTCIE